MPLTDGVWVYFDEEGNPTHVISDTMETQVVAIWTA